MSGAVALLEGFGRLSLGASEGVPMAQPLHMHARPTYAHAYAPAPMQPASASSGTPSWPHMASAPVTSASPPPTFLQLPAPGCSSAMLSLSGPSSSTSIGGPGPADGRKARCMALRIQIPCDATTDDTQICDAGNMRGSPEHHPNIWPDFGAPHMQPLYDVSNAQLAAWQYEQYQQQVYQYQQQLQAQQC